MTRPSGTEGTDARAQQQTVASIAAAASKAVANLSFTNVTISGTLGVAGVSSLTGIVNTGDISSTTFTMAVKPSITGSRGGNAALASLLTALAAIGLITDGSS